MRFLFVGEKRSASAIRMGVTWEDGRLAAKTLFAALRHCGLEPEEQRYANVFHDGDGFEVYHGSLEQIALLAGAGFIVVGLGRRVQDVLAAAGIAHLPLVHPAARGRIRARAVYQEHVADCLNAAATA